jgi:outer membrane lipoprotein SlyB
MKTQSIALIFALSSAALFTGCASTGPGSTQARPVLYPNANYTRMGEAQAKAEVDACMEMATKAVSAEAHSDTSRRVGQAAATTAVAAAVGTLVGGGNARAAAANAAGGAAVTSATIATAGAFEAGKANPTHRAFVQRCVTEKGLEIIGWQ